jgi:hypothetical protein
MQPRRGGRTTGRVATAGRVFAKPNRGMSPQGMTQPKASLPSGARAGACFGASAICVEAAIVKVLMTAAPLGVTVEGLKVQVAPSIRNRSG